jgi:hypothetical protein
MKKFNLYLQPEQLRKLRIIGDVSLGKPDVSSLIRQAIDTFIDQQVQANPVIKRALNRDPAPRLVRSSAGQDRMADNPQD